MPRRLPNLNAVKAFDAAARHQSFTEAAEELSVTQAAISRHVRLLERQLGIALFERHHRKVVLTTAGRRYAKVVERALLSLALDTGSLVQSKPATVILDVDSDLAQLWLLPYLSDDTFAELDITVDICVHPEPPRMLAAEADLAITWGRVDVPGFSIEPFLDYTAFPVCSPEIAGGAPGIQDTADVLNHRLIHDRGTQWWAEALRNEGLSVLDSKRNINFHRTYSCMYAALLGIGVAIGDDVSSGALLRQGQLVRPCGPNLPARVKYYLLIPDVQPLPSAVLAMVRWLRSIAKRHGDWYQEWQSRHGRTGSGANAPRTPLPLPPSRA